MKLIDKSALVAEIERLRTHGVGIFNEYDQGFSEGRYSTFEDILSFLDTIEVKEVDLEKEIELIKGDYEQVDVTWNNDFDFIARHFFELGMAVSNKQIKEKI